MNSSNIELHNLLPEEIIRKEFLGGYEERCNLVWKQMVLINSSLTVLEKFSNFQDCFLDPSGENVFEIIKISLRESILLGIWKLLCDADPESFTLRRFKNQIRRQIKDKYSHELDEELRRIGFDKSLKDIERKVRYIRKNFIAHLDTAANLNIPVEGNFKISSDEIRSACNQLNRLFRLLCFGGERAVLPPYFEIEDFLDLVVKNSPFFRMPEDQEKFWPDFRERLSPDKLKILNFYRKKFGLREV